MNFDVVVGNPPYHKDSGNSSSNHAIYNYFYDLSNNIADKYCLITPARFLFKSGSTSEKWDNKMLQDTHLKIVNYEENSKNVFPNTGIAGGVVIIYRDRHKDFGKIKFFTSFSQLNHLALKVSKNHDNNMSSIISGRGIYRLTPKAHKDHPEIDNIQSKGHSNDVGTSMLDIFHNILTFDYYPNDGYKYVQLFGRYKDERVFHWIRQDYINKPHNINQYKVAFPYAGGSGIKDKGSVPVMGKPIVLYSGVAYTETFISIEFSNKIMADNALKYIKTKFARAMLAVLKVTQHATKQKWSMVPVQDFSSNSDIAWNNSIPDIDKQLYKKYDLDDNDINFIESKVNKMD